MGLIRSTTPRQYGCTCHRQVAAGQSSPGGSGSAIARWQQVSRRANDSGGGGACEQCKLVQK
eukprot:654080-Prorocentrum_minimum.AAC.1